MASAFRTSLEAGVTLVYTGEVYGNGVYERIIGELLHDAPAVTKPVLATKFGPLAYSLWVRSLLKALDANLERLGVKAVDPYQIHLPSPLLNLGALTHALAEEGKEGKARRVGVSNYGADAMKRSQERLSQHCTRLAATRSTTACSTAP